MYKELTIKNIKTFEEEQKLKIAPITLLYGENSSGKTTILKALDIIDSIFRQNNRGIATRLLHRGVSGLRINEEHENISSRKIHFLSSKLNKKPIKIEIKLNLPVEKISKYHPFYSDQIFEQTDYFEEKTLPKQGPAKKTLSRKTIGTSTYITDEMSDGSLRRMVIRDTGRGRGKEKKFQISILGSSKIFKSKEKIKMAPINLSVEIKYFSTLKLSKINKLEIKNINNKIIISYLRKDKEYSPISKVNEFGFQKGNPKENIKRMIRDNPDFFTSSSGYADYKINITKDNDIWLNLYRKYEKIFSNSEEIAERLRRSKLLFKALNRFKIFLTINKRKDSQINWESFSEIVSTYILSNNQKKYHELESDLDNLFIFSKNLPIKINHKFIHTLVSEQTGMELIDGSLVWDGFEPENYFTDKILSKHLNARKYFNEIFAIMMALKTSKYKDFFIIEKLLTKKVSFKKFCLECRNSYKDHSLRFLRSPNLTGMGTFIGVNKGFIDNFSKSKASTNIEILTIFSNYIIKDIPNAFKYKKKSGLKLKTPLLKISSPHFLINNCIKQITKTVEGFVLCHPNKTESSYDVPMEEEFHIEEIEKVIGSVYKPRYKKSKEIKIRLKSLGINYKEIVIDNSQMQYELFDYKKEDSIIKKLYKNYKIIKEFKFKKIGYVADYLVIDKKNKKTAIEIISTLKKDKLEKDFSSIPESISPNGENFDDVICNNNKLRKDLNKILKPLLNLKIIVVTPEWLKNLSEDTYERLTAGWNRGSYRTLWNLRRKWPKKNKFIMLQDLNYNKFFNIHGREVGKGPSNILPFFAQLLSKKPNLTYLIQELENNWHPKNQSKIIKAIAEIMIKSENKNFILETHSELFILQIQKLVEKGILNKNDVSINYISRSKNGSSKLHHIPLNSKGGFEKPWPGGFFNERMDVLTS